MFARRAPAGPVAGGGDVVPAPLVAAPGIVEPKSEAVRVSAQVGGTLARVLVEEGDAVTTGQVVAELMNGRTFPGAGGVAQAELAAREADAQRIENGARVEERREAEADVRQADADFAHARPTMPVPRNCSTRR